MLSDEEDSQDESFSEEEEDSSQEDSSTDDNTSSEEWYSELVLDKLTIKAIKEGDVRKVEEWIRQVKASDGSDISSFIDTRKKTYIVGDSEISSKGMTALHYAAFYCQHIIVEKLLDAGADPTVTNSDEENALHVAMESESGDSDIEKVARILLAKKRDYIDATTGSTAWTALLMAVYLNHQKTVLTLLECGADPKICLKYGEDRYRYGLLLATLHKGDMLKWFIDRDCDVNQTDGRYSALHYAVKYFKSENVKLLVEHGANMFTRDKLGFYPIHYCIGTTCSSDFIDIVSILRKSVDVQDKIGRQTLLHLAVIQGKTEYVRILKLKFNAASFRKDREGRLPIHYLSGLPDVRDLVNLLAEDASTLNVLDKAKETPLHIAVQENDPEFAKVLLQNGADPTITAGGKEKLQLIHLAVIAKGTDKDFKEMVKVIITTQTLTIDGLSQHLDINQPDANGRTALHWALDGRNFSKARILLRKQADPSRVDVNQKNCLHIAFQRSCPGDIVKKMLTKNQGLELAKDKDGNTPLQYLSAKTPVSAITVLEDFDVTGDSNEKVQVTFRLETLTPKSKKIFVHPSISSVKLLQRAMTEFDRADIFVECYSKQDDSWHELDHTALNIAHGDTFKVKIVPRKKDPLDTAIELKRLDIVKLLLVKGAELTSDTLQGAIVREDSELAFILIRHARDIFSPLTKEMVQPSYSYEGHLQTKKTTLFRELICKMPQVAMEALNRCSAVGYHDDSIEIDYTLIVQLGENTRPSGREADNNELDNPLELMVRHKQKELLYHPVVLSYLYLNWNSYSFWFYAINFLLLGLFLALLCLFIVVVNDPLSQICQDINSNRNMTAFNESAQQSCGSVARVAASYILAVLVIMLSLYHLIVRVLKMVYDIKGFLRNGKNYVDVLLYVLCIVFVFNFANKCGCPTSWQWQIGIFVVFLGWMNLIFFASQIPKIGVYVLVFKKILITFLKLVSFSILLVCAFSLILYMMFSGPNLEIASFRNVGISFVKTLTMVTGELGFEDLFGLGTQPADYIPGEYHVSNFIMWIIFLVLLPIILNNMLTSLAVGDAKDVIENAELQRLNLQVKAVVQAPEFIKKRTFTRQQMKLLFGRTWRTILTLRYARKSRRRSEIVVMKESDEDELSSEEEYKGPVLDVAIIKAIKENDIQKIDEWIEEVQANGANVSNFIDVRKEKEMRTFGDSSDFAEISCRGMTALHYAALYCKPDIVQKLIDARADPTLTNEQNVNALHMAVEGEGDDSNINNVASILLQKRRDRDYIDANTGSTAWTALLIAVYLNHPKTVLTLLKCGADPEVCLKDKEGIERYGLLLATLHEGDMLKWFIDRKCDVNRTDGRYSALHYAVKYFKPENVKLLVKNGADMFTADEFGFYPIHYCINATSNSDFTSIVSTLKKSIDVQDDVGKQTLLHLAVIQGKTEFVRILRHKFHAAYSSRTDSDGNLPIHHLADLTGQQDVKVLVDLLGKTPSTLNVKNDEGETPLHIAVQNNNSKLVEALLCNGADPDITYDKDQKLQLIHLAASTEGTDADFKAMLEILKEFGINQPDANGRTPLHWALNGRQFSKAKILLDEGADPSPADNDKKNCLHIAFQHSCPGDVVKKILQRKQGLEVARDKDGNTPLHYLSAKTPVTAIKALEDFDVTVDSTEQIEITFRLEEYKRDVSVFVHPSISSEKLFQRAKTEFNRADIVVEYYNKKNSEIGQELVIADGDIFKVKIKKKKKEPLDTAIELKRLDVVKLLLVKGAQLTTSTLKDAIVREDSDLAFILIRHARDIISPLTEELQRPSYSESLYQEEKRTTLFRELISKMPQVAKEALDRCVSLGNKLVEFDYTFIQPSKPDADDHPETNGTTETDNDEMDNPLELMVSNKQIELLQHPVVWSYLYLKWNSLGFWFYAFKVIIFGLFLGILCLFVVVVNDPLSQICLDINSNMNMVNKSISHSCGSSARVTASYVFAALVILLALYHLVVEVIKMFYDIVKYLKDVRNYVEILLYVLCIVFVFNFANECGCPRSWQWQIGIFVVFLGWINLIFFASKIPRTGIYVLVFKEILITFLKLVAFSILLVFAFSLILYMMFSSPNLEIASFRNVGISFVKTLTMVTGELGFEDLFGLGTQPADYIPGEYHVSNFIMWIIFLVLLPIILNNMLVSLAVGDAKEVIENAELKKLILQVKTVVLAEEVVPNYIKKRTVDHIKRTVTFKFEEQTSPWNVVKLFIFGGTNYLKDLKDNTYFERRKEEQDEIRVDKETQEQH